MKYVPCKPQEVIESAFAEQAAVGLPRAAAGRKATVTHRPCQREWHRGPREVALEHVGAQLRQLRRGGVGSGDDERLAGELGVVFHLHFLVWMALLRLLEGAELGT